MTGPWRDPLAAAAARVLGEGFRAEVAVVLGSGLGPVVGGLPDAIPYERVPGLGAPGVPGHAGRVGVAQIAGERVLVFQGRRHLYEGITPAQAAFPVRLAARLGVRFLVLFAAAGGLDPALVPGTWVFVTDHLNWLGRNPLEAVRTPDGTPAFVDLTGTYRADLWPEVARAEGIPIARGVYAAFPGPTYETPAEIAWARGAGASVVGMSVVPEAVWARFLGLEVAAWARVANPAAGLGPSALDHRDVVAQAARDAGQGRTLLEATIRAWRASRPGAGGFGAPKPGGG
ncbi:MULTISPECIES: purine-nucleoside phosphorylase [Deferrisoma]